MAFVASFRDRSRSEPDSRAPGDRACGCGDVGVRRALRSFGGALAGNSVPGHFNAAAVRRTRFETISQPARRHLIAAVTALPGLLAACAPLATPVDQYAAGDVPSPESCAVTVAAAPKESTSVKVRVALAFAERGPDVRALQRSVLSDVLSQIAFPDVLDTEMGFCGDSTIVEHYPHAQPHHRDSRLWFRVRSDGALDSLAVILPALSPEIEHRIIAAIQNAGSTKRLGIPPPGMSQLIYVVSIYADSGHENIPVFDSLYLRGPRARAPKALPGNPKPKYPTDLQEAGVEGTVITQFVIGRDGRMRDGTLRILQSSAGQFTREVSSSLRYARFRPATVGRCPVPTIVEMPFVFALGSSW